MEAIGSVTSLPTLGTLFLLFPWVILSSLGMRGLTCLSLSCLVRFCSLMEEFLFCFSFPRRFVIVVVVIDVVCFCLFFVVVLVIKD